MKRLYILLILVTAFVLNVSSQTLAQAKVYYEQGEYAKAKSTFERFVKTQPGNGNYNLWYGVCCLYTGEPQTALKYIQTAVKKRITSGQLYLALTYDALYRYEEAIQTFEEYIAELEKRKKSTEKAAELMEISRGKLRYLKGVEEVCIVDSFVVDKKNFLDAYRISPESGTICSYDQYFDVETAHNGTVYETELGNKIYYGEQDNDGKQNIMMRTKLSDGWGNAVLLSGKINTEQNAGYPFVMTDGITLYYAADGQGSMGGYDIFVTRYNTATDSYLEPQNMGMPFNSPANDYMFAIDEFNNLGWFVTDRNQPEDKVCVYLFIPNATTQVYNYETMDKSKLIRLACLTSIQETQTDMAAVVEAKKRLEEINATKKSVDDGCDFCFIVDDQTIYHKLADFKSPKAKALFEEYVQTEKTYKQLSGKLKSQRAWYVKAKQSERVKMNDAILDLEKQVLKLNVTLEKQAIDIRMLEKKME